jgi:hypothetical protein
MAFSQEIKNEAHIKGFRCDEIDIDYRTRGGDVKLNAARDGLRNLAQLGAHRVRARKGSVAPVIDMTDRTVELESTQRAGATGR